MKQQGKKRAVQWLAAILLLMLLPAAASAAGSTAETATSLPLNGSWVSGTITSSTTAEYYKVVLTQPGYLSIDTRVYMGWMGLELYNTDLTTCYIGYNQHRYDGTSNEPGAWTIADYFEAGTYYVKVSRDYTTGSYDIKTSFTATNNTESGSDNNVSGANALGLNGSFERGLLSVQDGLDYWKVVLTQPGYLSIDTRVYMGWMGLELYNTDLTTRYIGYNQHRYDGTSNEPGAWTIANYFEAGTYYVKVSRDYTTGPYDIKASFTAYPYSGSEPNNTVENATPLAIRAGYTHGLLTVQDKIDYYKIVVLSDRKVTVNCRQGMRYIGVELMSEDLTKRIAGSASHSSSNASADSMGAYTFSATLKAGTYYLRVKAGDYGIYDIEVTSDVQDPLPPLTMSNLSYAISSDRKSIFIDKPVISGGSGTYQIAYNIYDIMGNAINYFYSSDARVAASPGANGVYNVFVVVSDGVSTVQKDVGWFELNGYPVPEPLTMSDLTFTISVDHRSIFVDKPQISGGTGNYTIAYNIYDINGHAVNYFYSGEGRVAVSTFADGVFTVFVVVSDGTTSIQKDIGWQVLDGYGVSVSDIEPDEEATEVLVIEEPIVEPDAEPVIELIEELVI